MFSRLENGNTRECNFKVITVARILRIGFYYDNCLRLPRFWSLVYRSREGRRKRASFSLLFRLLLCSVHDGAFPNYSPVCVGGWLCVSVLLQNYGLQQAKLTTSEKRHGNAYSVLKTIFYRNRWPQHRAGLRLSFL